jgi:voltage-gated potassium channel
VQPARHTAEAPPKERDALTVTTGTPAAGQPRSPQAAARLETYERRIRVPIVLSAVLPLLLVPEPGHPVAVVVGIGTWLVFLVDFVVHTRLLQNYTGTRLGKFDLLIVVLTAPWFLLPGANAGTIVVVLRLARLARLVVASRAGRELFARLGRVGIVAGGILLVSALIAYLAERTVNPEFASYSDALWWAMVTLTTVGYGDMTPITSTGRLAAVTLMLSGIAVLGLLAGSLASFLGFGDHQEPGDGAADEAQDTEPDLQDVLTELRALRLAVERLEAERS